VVLVDVSDRVHEVAEQLCETGISARACVADVGSASGAASVGWASDALGLPVDVLVNNAGINRDARAAHMSEHHFREVIRVDLVGPARLCDAFAGRLAEGASIINVSSRAALGNFGQANYVAAKSGLIGLTRALAIRWAPRVRVNAVAPGLIDTPMTQAMPADVLTKLVSKIPAGRMGSPDDVAAAIEFLASPQSAYVTGQFLPVCGGRSLS
jgi:NAD(P)-dependent dehydrogenase (short-subunit alcohol dehydrogenase family)